jgi:hypothetical protein
VDVFSKYGFAVPLKDKRDTMVVAVFEKIFSEWKPNMMLTDRGSELLNSEVRAAFGRHRVHYHWSFNDIKAYVVEKFNRTLTTKMFRYFTHRHTYRWVEVLEELIHSYSQTVHRAIAVAPVDVTPANADEIGKRLFPTKPEPSWRYSVGDKVRIRKYRRAFQRRYLPNWTQEVFVISELYPTDPVTYGLKDLAD